MKLFKKNVIVFSPGKIHCIFIDTKGHPQLEVLQQCEYLHLELEHTIIFNPHAIVKKLDPIFTRYNRTRTNVHFIINGPVITEQIIAASTVHPQQHELPLSFSPHKQTHISYLYPHDYFHYFYACSIAKPIVLQYTLLAQNLGFDLNSCSPLTVPLIRVYKKLYGNVFRHSQLAIDMQQNNNRIERLFHKDDISRMISLQGITLQSNDYIPVLAACGID